LFLQQLLVDDRGTMTFDRELHARSTEKLRDQNTRRLAIDEERGQCPDLALSDTPATVVVEIPIRAVADQLELAVQAACRHFERGQPQPLAAPRKGPEPERCRCH